jgi:hypothetical protein
LEKTISFGIVMYTRESKDKSVENASSILELTTDYFRYWNQRNVVQLRSLFAQNVELNDWEGAWSGCDQVINANKNIFDTFPEINISVTRVIINENTAICFLLVQLDKSTSLKVIDILTFSDRKIQFIDAYRQ